MLTLPALQDVCVPTTAFMRVWQLEGGRLARILRGQQLTLKYEHFLLTCFIPVSMVTRFFILMTDAELWGHCSSHSTAFSVWFPPAQEVEAN